VTFQTLTVYAFRNLADGEIAVGSRDVFLVGENGQGKTNVLEALYFSAYGSTFRGSRDGELIRTGEAAGMVEARLAASPSGARGSGAESVYDSIRITLDAGKKSIEIDGKKVLDRKDLLQVIPCIVFCHEDMDFVSGPPETRRRFFDQTESLYDAVYLEDLRRYRRVLKARNILLKTYGRATDDGVLDSLDAQLVEYGRSLMVKREEAARQFSALFGPLYGEVSGIPGIAVRYASSWRAGSFEETLARFRGKREQEKALGMTLSGPHRDRYLFMKRDAEFSRTASTGQRRLLALLLRAAQARRFSLMTGKNPVLLLDDVLLELDPEKRRRFLSVMPGYDQAFYTFLPEEPYERYSRRDALVYRVEGGVIRG
jgi:DNA replication and repair protein RecF